MEAPAKIQPNGLADYLEELSKVIMETGMNWRVIEGKWPGIRDAFDGFDPMKVADLAPPDIDRLMADPRVIRRRPKLEAIVDNARQMVDLEKQHGSFRQYLRSHGGFEQTSADLRKRFKFVGDMGAYHFLYVVGEDVPNYHEWCETHHREPKKKGY